MIDWKIEISRMVHFKQVIADHDRLRAYPWHLPRVGAKVEDIALAEAVSVMEFSAEYRAFLSHADGWEGFLVATDLFGTSDILSGRSRRAMERAELVSFVNELGLGNNDFLVVGASDLDLDVFLHLSPNSKTLPGGVLWFASEEVDRYESFSDFFESMTEYNAKIARRLSDRGLPAQN